MKRLLAVLATLTLVWVMLLPGCGGGSEPPPALTTITVTPDPAAVARDGTQVFTATGRDQHGTAMSIAPVWTVAGGIGTIISNGDGTATFTGRVVGAGHVRARQFGVEGQADVTVVGPGDRVLTTITMVPAAHELALGEQVDITATGRDQFGAPIDFAPTWSVVGGIGNLSLAPSAVTSSRRFTATTPGGGSVRASVGGIIGETTMMVTTSSGPTELTNLFFLHHSTGNGFVEQGDMRGDIATSNTVHGTDYELWDHGYNHEGLRNAAGTWTGTGYSIPGDNTDPDGLHTLWTTNNGARATIMTEHEVIAFKSCFPASAIPDTATLNQYKQWYREMRTYFDAHPERLFVVMSTPPLHRLATDLTQADNARAFADWLKSGDFLAGHANVVCFDLFGMLARADDGSATRNMLRFDYEQSHGDGDSHPNLAANQVVGPALAQFMMDSAAAYSP